MIKIFAATAAAFLFRAVSGFAHDALPAHDELNHAELRRLLDQATIHHNFGEDIAQHIPSAIRAELHKNKPEILVKEKIHFNINGLDAKNLEKLNLKNSDNDEEECKCKECVMKGARFIVGMAKKKIDEWCDDKKDWQTEFDKCEGRDCKKKMWCRFWN